MGRGVPLPPSEPFPGTLRVTKPTPGTHGHKGRTAKSFSEANSPSSAAMHQSAECPGDEIADLF
jgi:hypothetical protein